MVRICIKIKGGDKMNKEPKATIIHIPDHPLAIVKSATNMFNNREPLTDVDKIAELDYDGEINLEEHFRDLFKSDLQAPFEFLSFIIRFDNVTRAFTHQLVRTRTATYAHQSMRFINMEDFDYRNSIKDDKMGKVYDGYMGDIKSMYSNLVDVGEHPQDARGIIPTNVKNSIAVSLDYRTLLRMAAHRFCKQAQGEWSEVFGDLKEKIKDVHPVLAEGMVPGCYHSGICQFGADFDRTCGLYPDKETAKEIIKENWSPKDFDPDNDYL
jgi:thymidylate synthase ThyX